MSYTVNLCVYKLELSKLSYSLANCLTGSPPSRSPTHHFILIRRFSGLLPGELSTYRYIWDGLHILIRDKCGWVIYHCTYADDST